LQNHELWKMKNTGTRLGRLLLVWLLPALMHAGMVGAKKAQPKGLLALSAGDSVVLADLRGDAVNEIETGTVGFLFPAPGGILFAPDIIHNRTTVIDLRRRSQRETLSFLRMPRFTVWKDRYLVLAGDLLMLSYPENSLIFRMKADIQSPWQLYSSEDGMSLLVLERQPDGKGPSILTALDLGVRKRVFRKSFTSDMIRFAEMSNPGVLVLADRSEKQILILEPETMTPLTKIPLVDAPTDIVAVGNVLHAAGGPDGVRRWELKRSHEGKLEIRELDPVLTGNPIERLTISPDGLFFAAAGKHSRIRIYEARKARLVREIEIPPGIRDLVWVDPLADGPLLPMWSDQGMKMPEDIRPPSLRKKH